MHLLRTVSKPVQLASTPAQVHPLRTVSTASKPTNWKAHPFKCTCSELCPSPPTGNWYAHPFKCTRSELYPSPPTGERTRSSAPAQNCIQAHQLVSAPAQVHPLRTVSKPTNGKRTCSSAPAQDTSPPTGKPTRSSAPAKNCIQAHQLVSTPAQVHLLRTVSKPTNW